MRQVNELLNVETVAIEGNTSKQSLLNKLDYEILSLCKLANVNGEIRSYHNKDD